MRETKFRAWDKLKKSIHEVAGINFIEGIVLLWKTTGSVRSTYYVELESIELIQYTGLHDKNGKEIFEGDIVKKTGANLVSESYCNPYPAEIGDIFFVSKLDSGFTLIRASMFGDTSLDTPNIHGNIDNYAFWNGQRACEVIGNIYENKELLV